MSASVQGVQINGRLPLALFAGAFTAWAAVVGWGVHEVTSQIQQLHDEARRHDARQQEYQERTEHRITALEVEHQNFRDELNDVKRNAVRVRK